MMITANLYAPQSVVSFYTEKGEITLHAKATGGTAQGKGIDNSVVRVSTNNDLSNDAGTFQIQLANNQPWEKVLGSNDLVIIQMQRQSTSKDPTVFVGLIDDVTKTVSVSNNQVQRVVQVTGRTFAKALINFEVGVVPEVEATDPSIGWLLGRITFQGESAAQIANEIMTKLVYKYMNYQFGNGKTLQQMLKLDFSSRPHEKLTDQNSFVNFQGSIYDFLKEILNEPWNQMFFEVYNGVPTFKIRETPFNPDNWRALPLHTITDADVVMESIGRNDVETYTLYSVGCTAYFSASDPNTRFDILPLWYPPYFKKYGLRRLQRFTSYVSLVDSDVNPQGGVGDSAEQMKAYQQDLFNWNIMNPDFYSGTITVIGREDYKVGDRLLYSSTESGREIEFFIEGVSHEFVNYEYWITHLEVTRGLDNAGKGRFDPPWNQYQEYQGGALGVPVSMSGLSAADFGNGQTYTNTGGTITGTQSFVGPLLPNETAGAHAQAVINIAKTFIGRVTYRLGAGRTQASINANEFDCSSFVNYVFSLAGYNLNPQGSVTTHTLDKIGVAVPLSQIQPGDLIFFNTDGIWDNHVGIYEGDGKFIGCQNSGVNEQDVTWWMQHYGIGSIRRVIAAG